MRCFLLVGNYGTGNTGDEALKEYFLRQFSTVSWMVVSAHPLQASDVPRLPFGIRSLFSPWWRTIQAIRQCDGIVYGGGTLFADTESRRTCLLWAMYAVIAWLFGKKIILAFQGIGPCRGTINRRIVKWVLCHASYISARDTKSLKRVENWLSKNEQENTKIVQSFDPILLAIGKVKSINRSQKLIIIPRLNSDQIFFREVERIIHSRAWKYIILISMDPKRDQAVMNALRSIIQNVNVVVRKVQTMEEIAKEMSDASFVLTQRYHGGIAALALGVPFVAVPLVAGDKLEALNGWTRESSRKAIEKGNALLLKALQ